MTGKPRSVRAQRWSRGVVLWALGAFVLGQFALAVLIELVWPAFRDPIFFSRISYLARRQKETPSAPLVLLLGSSRVEWGLQARALESHLTRSLDKPVIVLDGSNPGCGPVRYLLNWDRLERHKVRPDLVFIEVFLPLFNVNSPRPDTLEVQLPPGQLDVTDAALVMRYDQRRPWLRLEQVADWLVPAHTHRLNVVTRLLPKLLHYSAWKEPDRCVDCRAQVDPARRAEIIRATRASYEGSLKNFKLGGPDCEALDELVGRLAAAGIPTVLLVMPEGPAFRSWYPPGRYEEIMGFVEGVARKHGAAVVNHRDWANSEEPFIDSYHLIHGGAAAYGEWFAREVLVPRLRSGEELRLGSAAPSRGGSR